jgi:hypothetical protein
MDMGAYAIKGLTLRALFLWLALPAYVCATDISEDSIIFNGSGPFTVQVRKRRESLGDHLLT